MTLQRSQFVVGNWKMNGCLQENRVFFDTLHGLKLQQSFVQPQTFEQSTATLALCVPYVYLQQSQQALRDTPVKLGAQNVSPHVKGAFTGEVSAKMLHDFGCQYVIVGHSERRQYYGESNQLVAQKALAALKSNIVPIVCVGETLEQKKAHDTLPVIKAQLQPIQSVLGSDFHTIIVAYEPVWAIGTGLSADPQEVQSVHRYIRKCLGADSDSISVLYGGSVKPSNASELYEQADVDGFLVGGASLNAEDFFHICHCIAQPALEQDA